MESGKVRIDTMTLKKEDYLINCNLRLDPNKKIFLHTSKPESAEYMTDSDHNVTMEEYRKNILPCSNGVHIPYVREGTSLR